MKIDIKVPDGMQDITLEQYQRFVLLQSDDELFLSQKCVEIFCNVPLILVDKMSYNDVKKISMRIFSYLQTKPQLIMKKSLGKRIFGFVPNLEQISLGEFTDIDSNITDWKNMHRVMAVLYRPIVNQVGEYYDIEEYDGTDKYAEQMKKMPLDVVMSALVFFYHLGIDLSMAMTRYLEVESKEISQQKQTLQESGDGMEAFTPLLKGALQNLKMLVDSPSIVRSHT